MSIRTLIVDDEPLARERLRNLLDAEPDIELLGESGDGADALRLLEELRPDLVFLDVQMPNLDGFSVVETLGDEAPVVVFVTAFDQFAVRAFDAQALDFLVKPFGRERFQQTLDRARTRLSQLKKQDLGKEVLSALEGLRTGRRPYVERLVIKSGGKLVFVRVAEIDWIEASGNYVRIHCKGETHLLRETMNGIETKLDPAQFIRIHRSRIANVERMKEVQPWFHGDYVVVMHDGTQLTWSAGYRERLQELQRGSG